MFKLVVIVLLVIIALSVNQSANNQTLTEQDKHQLFVQKQEQAKIEKEKQVAIKQEQLQKQKEMELFKSKSFSELKTPEDKFRWFTIHAEKLVIFLLLGFVFLMIFNKLRHNERY